MTVKNNRLFVMKDNLKIHYIVVKYKKIIPCIFLIQRWSEQYRVLSLTGLGKKQTPRFRTNGICLSD